MSYVLRNRVTHCNIPPTYLQATLYTCLAKNSKIPHFKHATKSTWRLQLSFTVFDRCSTERTNGRTGAVSTTQAYFHSSSVLILWLRPRGALDPGRNYSDASCEWSDPTEYNRTVVSIKNTLSDGFYKDDSVWRWWASRYSSSDRLRVTKKVICAMQFARFARLRLL